MPGPFAGAGLFSVATCRPALTYKANAGLISRSNKGTGTRRSGGPPRWQFPLLSRCISYLASQGARAVYCAMQGNGALKALHGAGFVRRDTGWAFMAHAARLTQRERAWVLDPSQWFLTLGDSNVDQPRDGVVYAA